MALYRLFYVSVYLTLCLSTSLHGQCDEVSGDLFLSGQTFRIPVTHDGVYKITKSWLEDNEMISSSVRFDQLQIYGQQGGALRHNSTHSETERLQQIAFFYEDDGNDTFDDYEEILLYASGPDNISYDPSLGQFSFEKNPFSDTNYIFIKIDRSLPICAIEMEEDVSLDIPASTDTYLYFDHFSEDKVNLLDQYVSTQGSGQRWFGDDLTYINDYNLSKQLPIPSHGLQDGRVKATLAGRSEQSEVAMLNIGQISDEAAFRRVNTSDIESLYARDVELELNDLSLSQDETISLHFTPTHPNAHLWLDQIELQGWTLIRKTEKPLFYNNASVLSNSKNTLKVENVSSSTIIWDVTDPYRPIVKRTTGSSDLYHSTLSSQMETFVAFEKENIVELDHAATLVEHESNILLAGDAELIIISDQLDASRLKKHRISHSGIHTEIIPLQSIYDLYSSGRQDPTAIRNYARDLYHHFPRFQYLLLFGDASFDYRHINQNQPHIHEVPTYETANSLDPLLAFPSDDYYALLDDGEDGRLVGDLDIGVGRLTVSNVTEARDVINKIIHYDTYREGVQNWHTRSVFVADDEDNNLHLNDADRIAESVVMQQPLIQVDKIYIDAYRQESTAGGNRYPAVTEELNSIAERGALVMNYLGHGGPNGWAQERILKVADLNSWTNLNRLPLIITATCSFTGFDDPGIISAGEAALLNPAGGALALFTTVRSVYASKNFQLTRSTFDVLFDQEDGDYLRLGEIMRRAKNDNPTDNTNARKYFLIGDPTTRLALPPRQVEVLSINDISLTDSTVISLSALDQVSVQAQVSNASGDPDTDFSGSALIEVYDKPTEIQTLANDARSRVTNYTIQKNLLFSGKVPIEAGKLNFSFVLPVDMNYSIGKSKISISASSFNGVNAVGYTEQLLTGGTAKAPVADDLPPEIATYFGDRSYTEGTPVSPNVQVLIDLSDDYGINLSTAAVGHEIVALLDDDRNNTFFLNDLYVSVNGRQTAGTISFRLEDMAPGPHELTIRAFDIANNVSEQTLEFDVVEELSEELNIILSPNCTSATSYVEADIRHGLADQALDIAVDFFSSDGQYFGRQDITAPSEGGQVILKLSTSGLTRGTYITYFTINSRTDKKTLASGAEKLTVLK